MALLVEEWLTAIGRFEWEAVSAIGSVAALFWAIRLAGQQAADQRRRDRAIERALHAIVDGVELSALQVELAWRTYERTYRLEAYDKRRDAESHFNAVRERAIHLTRDAIDRLRAVDVLNLPSAGLVDFVQSAIPKLIDLDKRISELRDVQGFEPEAGALKAATAALRKWTGEVAKESSIGGGSASRFRALFCRLLRKPAPRDGVGAGQSAES